MRLFYCLFCFSFLLSFSSCSPLEIDEPLPEEVDYSYLLNNSICLIEKDIIALDDSMFYISRDLGQSWEAGPRMAKGQIVRLAYLFEDGTLFYCTDDKCYYSIDHKTVSESIVLDLDNKPFTPSSPFHSFSAYEHDAKRSVIDGKEILCWGSYNNEKNNNPGFIPRIWITSDCGKTVTCSFKFG